MEATLNIVWLLLSALVGCAGFLHYRLRRGPKHPVAVIVITLAIIGVLLFPVISLSDDLNPALFASDEVSRRHLSTLVMDAHHAEQVALLPFMLMVLTNPQYSYVRQTSRDCEKADPTGYGVQVSGRAPPVPA